MNLPMVSIISGWVGRSRLCRGCRCIEIALLLLLFVGAYLLALLIRRRRCGVIDRVWRLFCDLFFGALQPNLIPNSKSHDNINGQSRSSAPRRMTTKKQLQKRNAGSLHYGGKCAASGRDDGVLLIPKSSFCSVLLSLALSLSVFAASLRSEGARYS